MVLLYCGTAVPFLYGTSTVVFTILFSTAIQQVPRFFGTVVVRCWHTVTKTALHFDWNCNLRLVFCRSPLNCTRFIYVFYDVLFYSVYQISEMTPLRQWIAWITITVLLSTAVFFHGTYRGAKSVVPRNTTTQRLRSDLLAFPESTKYELRSTRHWYKLTGTLSHPQLYIQCIHHHHS